MLARSALVLPMLLLVACSPGSKNASSAFKQPEAASFQPGPCRAVAPAVLSVGKDAHDLAGGAAPNAERSERLKRNQDLIDAARPGIEATLKPSFDQLVIGIGIVRIRTDSNTFDKSLGQALLKDYDAVVTACRA